MARRSGTPVTGLVTSDISDVVDLLPLAPDTDLRERSKLAAKYRKSARKAGVSELGLSLLKDT
jgi:hypothetical protein